MPLGLKKKSTNTLAVAQDRHIKAVGWLHNLRDELKVSSGLYDAAAAESSDNFDAYQKLAGEHLANILVAQQGKNEAEGTISNIDTLLSPPQVKIV